MSENADRWLIANGLSKYTEVFRDNDIDMRALPHMTEEDLRELGLSLGHRRIFITAVNTAAEHAVEADLLDQPELSLTGVDTTEYAEPDTVNDAEHRHLSVIFVDMVGSTQLSEQLDPEDMRDLLRGYHDTVATVVTRFGGHVAKYMGDGVLAYFGWPTAIEDHADRAVRAGLNIVQSIKNAEKIEFAHYAVRVGIASGQVVVGDLVGTNMREDNAMAGAVVNLAARLQGEAEIDSVVVSLETRNLIAQGFDLESLGERKLKGFETSREVFRAKSERSVETRFEALRAGGDSPLVGRDEELALLSRCWAKASEGEGQVVLLSGEAGIGKSRIAQAIIEAAEGEHTELLRFQCSPYHINSAFHPIVERLSRAAEISLNNDPETNYEKVAALVESQFLDRDRDTATYAALLGVETPGARNLPPLEPQELKHRFIQTLTRSVAERAAQHPLLMIVEDAHWLDPSSLETFQRVVEICGDLSVMLVVTHRPEWTSDWASIHPHVTALQLGRLSRDHVGELIEGMLDRRLEDGMIEELVDRSDGVPLFVEELARALGESDGDHFDDAIPESLQGVLLARLERVSRKARKVSLVASVIGREFEPDLLGAVAELASEELGSALEELRRANIIYESGLASGSFAFRHALIQDAAYQAMLKRTRRPLHGKLARAIEKLRPGDAEREPEVVARHFTEAGEAPEALSRWTAATLRALERSATYEAVNHAHEALAAAGRVYPDSGTSEEKTSARILLSRAYSEAGNLPKALEESWTAADEAVKLDHTQLFAEAAMRYMDSVMLLGDDQVPAIDLCKKALADIRLEDIGVRCKLMAHLARGLMMNGDFDESRQYGREAEAMARQLGDKRALFSQMMSRFFAPVLARDKEEVADWRERIHVLLDLADQIDDSDRGRASSIATYVATEMGDRELMEDALRRLEEVGAARQHMHLDWVGLHGRAMKAILDGEFERAEKLANEARSLGVSTHGSHVEGLYGVQMFSIRREQGRLPEVAPIIKRLLDENPEDAGWKPGFALIAAELGHLDAAGRMMREMAESDFYLPLDAKYSATLGYLSDTAVMIDDVDMAATLYERLLPYRNMTVTIGVATVCYGSADRRLGALAALQADWSLAEEHFINALELDKAMRAVPWLARSQAEYAHALLGRGRPQDRECALRLINEAMETAQKCGMVALSNELRIVRQ